MAEGDWLILTPDRLKFANTPDLGILMRIDLGANDQFLEHPIAIRMTPTQARETAAHLAKLADEAETLPPAI